MEFQPQKAGTQKSGTAVTPDTRPLTDHEKDFLVKAHADAFIGPLCHAEITLLSSLQTKGALIGRTLTPYGGRELWNDERYFVQIPVGRRFVPEESFAALHRDFVRSLTLEIGAAGTQGILWAKLLKQLKIDLDILKKAWRLVVQPDKCHLFHNDREHKLVRLSDAGVAFHRQICQEEEDRSLKLIPEKIDSLANLLYYVSRLPGFNGLLRRSDTEIALRILGLNPVTAPAYWERLRVRKLILNPEKKKTSSKAVALMKPEFEPSESFDERELMAAFAGALEPRHAVTIAGEHTTIGARDLLEKLRAFEIQCREKRVPAFELDLRRFLESNYAIHIERGVLLRFLDMLESYAHAQVKHLPCPEAQGDLRPCFQLVGRVEEMTFPRRADGE